MLDRRVVRRGAFGITCAAICALSAPALAQDSAASQAVATDPAAEVGTEEITVTARRRAESLQDVPAAVTAFSAQTIENAGI
ncbi:MAG: hypothetical protein Q7J32_05945, partial [Sphingomonadaceae bacterium]|nr:hypothetical protein [Sphingomonadaceae bacterium]